MALPTTETANLLSKQAEVVPNLVFKLEGFPTLFGSVEIFKFIRIGDPDLYIGDDWFIGGYRALDDQAPYISFKTGTTARINQKVDPSRGRGSTVTNMVVSLVDKNEEVSKLISPGFDLNEILGVRGTIYSGFRDSAWPEDYVVIFSGTVQEVESGAGYVNIVLNNPEEKKRASVIERGTTETTSRLNYRSVLFQDLFYSNKSDVTNTVTVTYTSGGTAGSEVVTVMGTDISVQIENSVSTATQIKKAIESSIDATQFVDIKTEGNSSNTQVTGGVTLGISTTLNVDSTAEFALPGDDLQTYVRINDELIQYSGKTATTFTGLTRAAFNSVGEIHNDEADVESVYRLTGHGLEIALKIMLSNGPTFYKENIEAVSFVYYDPTITIDNAVFFDEIDIVRDLGVAVGDLITIAGSTGAQNDLIDSIVLEVGSVPNGSFMILSDTLVIEFPTTATVSFKSQWNVLPIGLGMTPEEVDVTQHLYLKNTFLPIFTLDLFFNDLTNGKDFVEQEVYLPMACYSVPRKGRSSVVYHVGPLPTYEIVSLDSDTVINAPSLRVKRSTSENFFNEVVYNMDYDPVEEKYATTLPIRDMESQDRIIVGKRPFQIRTRGLRGPDGLIRAEQASFRYLKRYALGAEFIKGVEINTLAGYRLEIGDIVSIDFADLNLTDSETGNREGEVKLFEVINKVWDNSNGKSQVDIVNTIYGVDDRFGTISPATIVGTGSTTSKIIMQKSYTTRDFERESTKWSGYAGQNVIVHSEDWSTVYSTTIQGFDNNTPQGMLVATLPAAPALGWIVQAVDYPSTTDANDQLFWKQRHAFWSHQILVTSSVSTGSFFISLPDIALGIFRVGSIVRVHNYSYSDDSGDLEVTAIDSGTGEITLNESMGFVPVTGDFVDLIGFPDAGSAYRIL